MELVLDSRFAASFFAAGIVPNPIDIRFQRVSGLSATVETTTIHEGGQNLRAHRLPRRVGYQNLVLERGFVIGSRLHRDFNTAMTAFQFAPCNVMVALLGADAAPIAAWMFVKAFPVRWAAADLSARDDQVLIETLELCFASMQAMRV
jgi:phage tail-like protein